jgi:hypothetical protein
MAAAGSPFARWRHGIKLLNKSLLRFLQQAIDAIVRISLQISSLYDADFPMFCIEKTPG